MTLNDKTMIPINCIVCRLEVYTSDLLNKFFNFYDVFSFDFSTFRMWLFRSGFADGNRQFKLDLLISFWLCIVWSVWWSFLRGFDFDWLRCRWSSVYISVIQRILLKLWQHCTLFRRKRVLLYWTEAIFTENSLKIVIKTGEKIQMPQRSLTEEKRGKNPRIFHFYFWKKKKQESILILLKSLQKRFSTHIPFK